MTKNLHASNSRRNFLKASALLATATAVGFGGMFGLNPALADDDPGTILNIAATAETFAVTHYYRALKTNLFSATTVRYLAAALDQELQHLQFLNANGGMTLATKFYFPAGAFKTAKAFGMVTSVAETVFVGAYLAATRRFAELGVPLLAATAAQVAAVEAQHLALVRQIAEELPNNISLGEPSFYNVSDAVPVLQPLLDGSKGSLGDMETAPIDFPGADKVIALIGKRDTLVIEPFLTKKFIAPTAAATVAATSAATFAATTSK